MSNRRKLRRRLLPHASSWRPLGALPPEPEGLRRGPRIIYGPGTMWTARLGSSDWRRV